VNRRSTTKIALVLASGLALSSCAQAQLLEQLESAPAVNLSAPDKLVAVSPAAGGNAMRQQLIGDKLAARAMGAMEHSKDAELEAYLNAIVRRLRNSSAHGPSALAYRVYLVESPHANAFTPGGGHIFVTTGIVRKLRTEAQMAMVLAHEMAHNQASHVVKGRDGQSLSKRVTAFGKRVFDDGLGVPWLSSGVKALADTSLSTYTRAQEEDADMIGFRYFVSAGYDPKEAPRSFAALIETEAQKKSLFDVFDGYPEGLKRAEAMNAMVHATYREVDTSRFTGNSETYVRLGSAYWQ
jgi:predicted Zn-dependent protease